MSVPKPIHKYLLGEGFRYGGRGGYCKFFPDKPVAWCVDVSTVRNSCDGTPILRIQLFLLFPNHRLIDLFETLCPDGLLRWQGGDDTHFGDRFNEALEVLRANLGKWMAVIADPDVMLAMIDFEREIRSEPPPVFAYTTGWYRKFEKPKMGEWEGIQYFKRRMQEVAGNAAIEQEIKDFKSGKRAEPPTGLEDIAWFLEPGKNPRCAGGMRLHEKKHYLLFAGRYEELKELLEQNLLSEKEATSPDFAGDRADYRYMLACAEQKKIIVLDSFREWAEKKKLIAQGTWESVPDSTFEDAGKQADAGDMEDMYAIFFSGGRKAAAAYLQAQHGVDITGRRGKRVEDALDAACDDDESQLILCAPNRRWSVLMGSVAQVADEEGEDTALSRHLSAASKIGKDGAGSEALFICSQDTAGALWFEYHKNGACLRQWACADGDMLANTGAPLNELDARTFGAEIGEDGPPESGTLMELAEKITGIQWDALCTPGAAFALE